MRYSMHFVKQSLQVFASIHSCLKEVSEYEVLYHLVFALFVRASKDFNEMINGTSMHIIHINTMASRCFTHIAKRERNDKLL
jgi:hypothetical protein